MDYESMEFKIPEESNTKSMTGNSRVNVKGMLDRYRKEQQKQEEEIVGLKRRLYEAYDKLGREIEMNNQNGVALDSLRKELEQERSESAKVKQVLHSVIQNRKHMEKELTMLKDIMKAAKEKEEKQGREVEEKTEEVERERKAREEVAEELRQFKETFQSRVKNIKSQNVRFENQKIKLERQIIEKDAELLRLKEENRKLNYLHVENNNLLKQIEQLKGNGKIDASQYRQTSQSKENVQSNMQENKGTPVKQVGKWKRPPTQQQLQLQHQQTTSLSMSYIRNQSTLQAPTQDRRSNRREFSKQACSSNWQDKNQKPIKPPTLSQQQSSSSTSYNPFPNQTPLSIDQALTIQQKRKEQLESDLNKLTNLKKLTPYERKVIDELERSLYQVNSQIAGLKRKIRHRY